MSKSYHTTPPRRIPCLVPSKTKKLSLITMTIPDEFFVGSLTEAAPPSPSIFIDDLPPMREGDSEGQLSADDLVLPYISRVLMEDTDDMFLLQYCDDPALQEVEQPFAQILCCPSLDSKKDSAGSMASSVPLLQAVDCSNTEVPNISLQCSSGDQCALSSGLSKSVDAVGAFLKGMEEATKFLPKNNIFSSDELVDQILRGNRNGGKLKKRNNREEHLEGEEQEERSRKAVMTAKLDDIAARKMFEELMLHLHETCLRDLEKLRITKANEGIKNKRNGGRNAVRDVVDLRTLLILCAQAVSANNHSGACELLKQIRRHASAQGDATQRLAQCFADGLEARLTGVGSQVHSSLMINQTSTVEFLKAYKLFMVSSCFNKVALIFSTMTIMSAMEGKNKLHIVDFGSNFGLQWSTLLRLLANRENGPPEVKMTTIGRPKPRSCPAEKIETGCRLSDCARVLGVSLKLQSIIEEPEAVSIKDLNIEANEVLIVNDNYNFSMLMDESTCFDSPSPRHIVLNNIREMRPNVFIQSVVNCSNGTSFLTRFREALFHFTALFDMFEATIPRDSEPRLVLEQQLLGRSVHNIVACEGSDLIHHPEKYKQWQLRNQRAGLRQLPVNPNIIQVLRDKVAKYHHKDFFLGEDDQWLIQGWNGRVLFAHSTWMAK
ncbi:hypothetical protein ACP4OV_013284 [Aristida adscensionis]